MKSNKIQMARYLRQEQTPAEEVLWEVLRNRQFENLKFRRQHPLKKYIVDFFCDELELVIELDGGYHNTNEQKEKDELRDTHLQFLGYRVLRFKNEVVFSDLNFILNEIKAAVSKTKEHFKITKTKTLEAFEKSQNLAPSQQERVGVRDISILSTKKLKPNQRDLLLGAGFKMVDYNAISINFLDFEVPSQIENSIFTSQNAVQAFLKNSKSAPFSVGEGLGMRVFCVGQKTKALLEKNRLKVIETAKNSKELGQIIAKNYKNESFYYFCGTIRRDELPELLQNENIKISEIETYKTELKPKKFDQKWDGILFFSPSGVESYFQANKKPFLLEERAGVPCFCIGETTAVAARKYSDAISVANQTTVESVIAKAVKVLRD